MNSKDNLTIVAGPTASGKTKYAIELAKKTNAVLINTDSRQIYKRMNIGTNKGLIVETGIGIDLKQSKGKKIQLKCYDIEGSGVTGYMFDIVRPDEMFTLSDFVDVSRNLLVYFKKKKVKVIFVGGTGLYIDSLIKNTNLPDVAPDSILREKLRRLSIDQLYDELYAINESEARTLNESDRNNKRRLVRRIEIATAGKHLQNNNIVNNYQIFYPIIDRNELYKKIDSRVEEMFVEGFIEEVKHLIEMGYRDTKPMQGMGYKEIMSYLNGEITLDMAKDKIKQAHRNYATRQITWFEGQRRGYDLFRVDFTC